MGMVAATYYTADMVRALPDDGYRYETVHGELLVTPTPRADHQYVIAELMGRLYPYLKRFPVGRVLTSPADISWAPDVLVQPDLFVAAIDEVQTFEWKHIKTLLLVIEVLSPSTTRYDRFTKRRVYQEFGVPLYWMVDIPGRASEIWTPETSLPVIERERLVWQPVGASEPLVIALEEILPPPGAGSARG
ncbi:MAG TPA: Uma2 family endonuclease [Gemmatimonadales bacterium]|nr:Uma2 family endonuclease [Gemmatimonadales bacterium]